MHETDPSPAKKMLALATGYQVSRAVYIVAKLGVPDLLSDGPLSAGELAAATNTDPEALYRILRCVAAYGVVEERPGRTFVLTPLGTTLRRDTPDSVRAYTILCHEELFRCWTQIEDAARTGEPRFEKVFGVPRFAYLHTHPEAGDIFHDAMADIERLELPNLVPSLIDIIDAADAHTVIDVGGGHGTLLSAVLARRPALATTLLDLAPGIEAAEAEVGGPLPGCELVVGDYFSEVPAGGDLYILQQILHIWSDEKCVTILRHCREAMAPGGRLLIIERKMGAPNEPAPGKLQDVNMMMVAGGKERTADEFAALLRDSGLRLARELSTPSIYDIFEAVPAG